MNKFFGRWNSYEEMIEEWFPSYYDAKPDATFPKEKQILFASYGGSSYTGDAFVLFKKGETIYEVNGSHCSCYGLSGQWSPEETTASALKMKDKKEASSHYYFLSEHDHDAYIAYWNLVDKMKVKK